MANNKYLDYSIKIPIILCTAPITDDVSREDYELAISNTSSNPAFEIDNHTFLQKWNGYDLTTFPEDYKPILTIISGDSSGFSW